MAQEPDDGGEEAFKTFQVTNVCGIDDNSFNAAAWKGVLNGIQN
jgi:hypothetical protein